MNPSALAAAFWGAVTGAAAVLAETRATNLFNQHLLIWIGNGLYIGTAVGLFLRYFYRDDRRIENQAEADGRPADYGRDAHWLEPFFFGAVAYLIAFLPRSFSLAVIILVIGAMSGVVATVVAVTGIIQWFWTYPYVQNQQRYLLYFGVKMAGAIGLFSITFLLALPNEKHHGMQRQRAFWSGLNIVCGLTILIGAALMRSLPRSHL